MVIEAEKGGHTQLVKLLLEWPKKKLALAAAAEQVSPLNVADAPAEEVSHWLLIYTETKSCVHYYSLYYWFKGDDC